MSINRPLRQKLKSAKNNKEHKLLWLKWKYPPYFDEGWTWKNNISNHKWRAYRTWKHNRRYKWK